MNKLKTWLKKKKRNAVLFYSGVLLLVVLVICGGPMTALGIVDSFLVRYGLFPPPNGGVFLLMDDEEVPEEISKSQMEAILLKEKDKLLILTSPHKGGVNVKCNGFLIPNWELATTKFEWHQVISESGRNVLGFKKKKEHEFIRIEVIRDPGEDELPLWDQTSNLRYADATMEVSIPLKFSKLTFKKKDVGKTKKVGPISVTLDKFEAIHIYLTIDGGPSWPDSKFLCVPYNKYGNRIHFLGFGGGPNGDGTWYRERDDITGEVDMFELYFPTEFYNSTLSVRANSVPELRKNPTMLVDPPRYIKDLPSGFVNMSLTTLLAKTKIMPHRMSEFPWNLPGVSIQLPRVPNSVYAVVDAGKPKLYGKWRKSIEYDLDDDYDINAYTRGIHFRNEDDYLELIDYSRAVGKFRVRYPAKIKEITFTPEQPQQENLKVEFHGSRVVYPYKEFPEWMPWDLREIHAYDESGRRLKDIYDRWISEGWQEMGFWGVPKKVKMLSVEKWIDIEIPFNLPPAPYLEI